MGSPSRADLPSGVVISLNNAINKALQKPRVIETFAKLGATPAGGTAEAFGTIIKEQVVYWGSIIRRSRHQDVAIGLETRARPATDGDLI